MKTILQGWNFMRILRLVFAVAILVQGIVVKDPVTIILGFVLGGMAFANIGCCGTNGCAISTPASGKTRRIQYEEVDIKK